MPACTFISRGVEANARICVPERQLSLTRRSEARAMYRPPKKASIPPPTFEAVFLVRNCSMTARGLHPRSIWGTFAHLPRSVRLSFNPICPLRLACRRSYTNGRSVLLFNAFQTLFDSLQLRLQALDVLDGKFNCAGFAVALLCRASRRHH